MLIPEAYHDLLRQPVTAVLTTLLAGGAPQASPVWFLFEDGSILISTTRDRLKSRNVERDPRLAFTVIDPATPLRYLEVRGTGEVTADETKEVRDRVARKHGYADGAAFDAPGAERLVIRIIPQRIIEH